MRWASIFKVAATTPAQTVLPSIANDSSALSVRLSVSGRQEGRYDGELSVAVVARLSGVPRQRPQFDCAWPPADKGGIVPRLEV